MTREIFTCIFTLRAGSRCLQPTPIDVRGLAPPPRNVDPHFPLSIIQSSIQSSNLNHPIIHPCTSHRRWSFRRRRDPLESSIRGPRAQCASAVLRAFRIVCECAAGSRASHPRRGSPVVDDFFRVATAHRLLRCVSDRLPEPRTPRRPRRGRSARRVVDIEGRPDDPRRRVAAEKNGRHPRHGWRAHDRSFAPSRRRRPKDGASAAANARVRERRRSGSSDDPEARKSHAALEHGVSRGRSGSGRASSVAGRAARANAPDGRRGPRGPRVAGRQRPARIFRRRTSLPRRMGRAPRDAAPARGGIQSSVEECCPGCCPRSPARRSGRSSAGPRSREGFIEPRARVPRPRMRLPSALFGVGSVRERETGVVAARLGEVNS